MPAVNEQPKPAKFYATPIPVDSANFERMPDGSRPPPQLSRGLLWPSCEGSMAMVTRKRGKHDLRFSFVVGPRTDDGERKDGFYLYTSVTDQSSQATKGQLTVQAFDLPGAVTRDRSKEDHNNVYLEDSDSSTSMTTTFVATLDFEDGHPPISAVAGLGIRQTGDKTELIVSTAGSHHVRQTSNHTLQSNNDLC